MPKDSTVVFVLGLTGAGKSNFINVANGKRATKVGNSLTSCTQHARSIPVRRSRNTTTTVLLVDTPGFNDTYLTDAQVLKRIRDWIDDSLQSSMKIAGVVCVHEISERNNSPDLSKVLECLCNKGAARSLILVTTKWDTGLAHNHAKYEEEFKRTRWSHLLSTGCHIARFTGTWNSAWDVVNTLLDQQRPIDHDEFRSAFCSGIVQRPKKRSGNFFKRIFRNIL